MSDKKDAIYGYVTGTVTDVGFTNSNDMFARVAVLNKLPDGREFSDEVTAWGLKDCMISKGDRLTVSGFLSFKAETYEKDGVTRAGKKISLNGSKIREQTFAGAVSPEEVIPPNDVPPADAWDVVSVPFDEDAAF